MSVSDKSHLGALAAALIDHRVEVLSTGGTYKALCAEGVAAVKVSEFTGAPEILDGRVKTLHPKIHGGILALPNEAHERELKLHGIPPIDLVVVNLYPFRETVARPDCTFAEAIENIDIGGPTMVRSAAKNWPRVCVIVDPADYDRLAQVLDDNAGQVPESFRREMACKAFEHTAAYDAAIATYLLQHDGHSGEQDTDTMPRAIYMVGESAAQLRYGENPHQEARFFKMGYAETEPVGLDRAIQHNARAKALSYNNLLDADAALGIARDLAPLGRAAAVFKHLSPCGAAVAVGDEPLAAVYRRAREADSESAFGGIVSLTDRVDLATAQCIVETFIEVVVAPSYAPEALALLVETKKNLRVLEIPGMLAENEGPQPLRIRSVAGGLLIQREDEISVAVEAGQVVSARRPNSSESISMDLGQRVAKHVRSNAVVLVKNGVTTGIGGGQTSRVEAVRQALARAGEQARGSVLASDAFFPFRDSIDRLAEAGVAAVVQPGGSKRDGEVIAAADEHGMAMVFTGQRHFRH